MRMYYVHILKVRAIWMRRANDMDRGYSGVRTRRGSARGVTLDLGPFLIELNSENHFRLAASLDAVRSVNSEYPATH